MIDSKLFIHQIPSKILEACVMLFYKLCKPSLGLILTITLCND